MGAYWVSGDLGMVIKLGATAHPLSRPHSLIAQFANLPMPTPCLLAKRAMWRVLERTMLVLPQCNNAPMWCSVLRCNMARFLLASVLMHQCGAWHGAHSVPNYHTGMLALW